MINIQEIIEEHCDQSIRYELKRAAYLSGFLHTFKDQVETLDILPSLSVSERYVEIIAKDRGELQILLQMFGGSWNKTPVEYYPDKINYNQANVKGFNITIRSDPPPSCQIIEVEELVPASVRKVKKIVCPKEETTEPSTPPQNENI